MRNSPAIGATATLLAVLAAAGCSGGSSDSPSSTQSTPGTASSTPAPSSATSSAAPSTSPSSPPMPSGSGTAAGAPGVPEAARQHTKAGATAFVAHYLEVMNRAAQKPRSDPLVALSKASCKTCKEWAEVFTTLIKDGTHYDAPVFEAPSKVRTLEIDANSYHLFFDLRQSAANIRRTQGGEITDRGKRSSMKVVFELNWTEQGWRTSEVQKNA